MVSSLPFMGSSGLLERILTPTAPLLEPLLSKENLDELIATTPTMHSEHQLVIDAFLRPTFRSMRRALDDSTSGTISLDKRTITIARAFAQNKKFEITTPSTAIGRYSSVAPLEIEGIPLLEKMPRGRDAKSLHKREQIATWRFPKHTLPLLGVDRHGNALFLRPTAFLADIVREESTIRRIGNIMEQSLTLIAFLHSKKTAHNALSLHSFAFIEDNRLVLTNCLFATTSKRSIRASLPPFPSPESSDLSSRASDIWALAFVFIQLLTQAPLIECQRLNDEVRDQTHAYLIAIDRLFIKYRTSIQARDPSGTFRQVIKTMLIKERYRRPSARSIVSKFFHSPPTLELCDAQTTALSNIHHSLPQQEDRSFTREQLAAFDETLHDQRELLPPSPVRKGIAAFLLPTIRSAQMACTPDCKITIRKETLEVFLALIQQNGELHYLYSFDLGRESNGVCAYKVGKHFLVGKKLARLSDTPISYHKNEQTALWRLKAPQILPIIGVAKLSDSRSRDDTLSIFPSLETNLFQYQTTITADTLLLVVEDLLEGVAYLHKHQILHGDLKPLNVLVTDIATERPRCLIIDFESACSFPSREDRITASGTECFSAPEILEAYRFNPHSPKYFEYDGATDIWALGAIFFELLVKGMCSFIPPKQAKAFCTLDSKAIDDGFITHQLSTAFKKHEKTVEELDPTGTIQNMIWEMLVLDPRHRPTAEKLLNDLKRHKTSTLPRIQMLSSE